MILDIDPSNGVPIFMQVVQQIKYKIATGVLQANEQLPSVRLLAANLRINPNTVAKAYTELERSRVIYTKRGMGCYVSNEPVAITKKERRRLVSLHIDRAFTEAFHLDITVDEVQAMFDERVKKFNERKQS